MQLEGNKTNKRHKKMITIVAIVAQQPLTEVWVFRIYNTLRYEWLTPVFCPILDIWNLPALLQLQLESQRSFPPFGPGC